MTARRPPKKVSRQLRLGIPAMADQIDWTKCPDVEQVPGRCSGQPVVRGTRVLVQGILDNADDFTAEEIASEIYELPVDVVRRILEFST